MEHLLGTQALYCSAYSSEPDGHWFLTSFILWWKDLNFSAAVWPLVPRRTLFNTHNLPSLSGVTTTILTLPRVTSFLICLRMNSGLPKMHHNLSHASLPLGPLLFKSRFCRNGNYLYIALQFQMLLHTSSHLILHSSHVKQQWSPFY